MSGINSMPDLGFEKLDELIATKLIPDIRNLIVHKNVRPPLITISLTR